MKKIVLLILASITGIFILLNRSSEKTHSPDGIAAYKHAHTVIPELMNSGTKRISPVKIELISQKTTSLSPEFKSASVEFKNHLRSAFDALPTIQQIQTLPPRDGHHHTSESIMATSEIFGGIADRIKKDPKLIPNALKFYSGCGKNEAFPISIRALCIRNLEDWSIKSGLHIKDRQFPSSIQQIADNLPKRR